MGVSSLFVRHRLGLLGAVGCFVGCFVGCLWAAETSGHAKPRDRGEPPPLRAADLAPKSDAAPQADAIDTALLNSDEKPAAPQSDSSAVTCQSDRASSEAKVVCSDGKSHTMRSAALLLPTTSRCSNEHPECCQIGYGSMRELQIADLLRVGRGQSPICHVRVEEVKTNPPVAAVAPFSEDDEPAGLRVPQLGIAITAAQSCPTNMYLVSGRCYDTKELMRVIRPKTLADNNRVLINGAGAMVAELRQEFDSTGLCPDGLDNTALLRFDEQAKKHINEAPLDVTPLLARPETPGLSRPEPQLPVVCSYRQATQEWLQTSLHCTGPNLCFAQSQSSLPHNCIRFERATGQGSGAQSFFPLSHCQDLPSCFSGASGTCVGVARFSPLGSGVFLVAQEDAKKQRNEFSIVFARRHTRTPVEIALARQARTILHQIGRLYLSGDERQRFNAFIDAQPE